MDYVDKYAEWREANMAEKLWEMGLTQKYFEEHHEYFPDDPQGLVYFAELLIDRRKKDEARPLLEKAVAGDEPYYSKWAKELLEKL